MSFFDGDEAIAIIKVPEELYELYTNAEKVDNIGTLVPQDKKSAKITINTNEGDTKNFKITIPEVDRFSILFQENKGEYKAWLAAGFKGTAMPDDGSLDEYVNAFESFVEDTKKEFEKPILRADKIWEAPDLRQQYDYPAKSRERKAEFYTENDLKQELFRLFGEKETISYDDLKSKTNASKNMLDSCLRDICEIKEPKVFRLKEQYRRDANIAGVEATLAKKKIKI